MWRRLESFFKSSDSKITADRYFEICEQLGQEPDPKKVPVSWEDLPEVVRIAVNIFNTLGDRVAADIGYLGKDYTALSLHINQSGVDDIELLLEIITWLDSRAITKSAEHMKRERDKLKRK